jgi:signal transduction histidine kinase
LRDVEQLVARLLDVSQMSRDHLILEPEPTSLAAIVRDVVARLSDTRTNAATPLVLHVEQDIIGLWDRDRIEHVVTSLVANALKYGRGKPVEVDLSFDGDAVLSVTDHGDGIDPDRRHLVFDKFDRAGRSRDHGGFGLGLWMSRKIVEASGGKIDIHSELGRGSSFVVRLPTEASAPLRGSS